MWNYTVSTMRGGSHFVKSMQYVLVITCTGYHDCQGKGRGDDSGTEL
jgi:hypothetical protein